MRHCVLLYLWKMAHCSCRKVLNRNLCTLDPERQGTCTKLLPVGELINGTANSRKWCSGGMQGLAHRCDKEKKTLTFGGGLCSSTFRCRIRYCEALVDIPGMKRMVLGATDGYTVSFWARGSTHQQGGVAGGLWQVSGLNEAAWASVIRSRTLSQQCS